MTDKLDLELRATPYQISYKVDCPYCGETQEVSGAPSYGFTIYCDDCIGIILLSE